MKWKMEIISSRKEKEKRLSLQEKQFFVFYCFF